jgi:AraC-like DNA-binding protein
MKFNPNIQAADWKAVAEKYLSGVSMEKLAKEVGCSVFTVHGSLLSMGIVTRPRGTNGGANAPKFFKKALSKNSLQELYANQQLSTLEIAKQCNVSPAGVRSALIRHGIPLRTISEAHRVLETWDHDWIDAGKRYATGLTLQDIATEFGCSLGTVVLHFRRNNIPTRPRGTWIHLPGRKRLEIDMQKAAEMNQNGATLTKIGAHFGVSVQVALKRFKDAGIPVIHNRTKVQKLQVQKKGNCC